MKNNLYSFINGFVVAILVSLAAVAPLLFLNLTTDFYDMPKLILLVIASLVLLTLWVVSWVARGKVVITRTPLDIPLLMLLITIIVSTVFSTSKYSSIYGVFPDVHGSAISWVTYIILYFVTVSNLQKIGQVKMFLYALYISASVLAFISILSFFQVFLPFDMAQGVNFTPTGSTFATTAFLTMLLPLPLISTVNKNKYMPQALALTISVLFSATIALIGSTIVSVVMFLMFVGVFLVARNHMSKVNFPLLLTPIALSVLLVMLVNLQFPGNKFQSLRYNFPQEVQLPIGVSWKISASAFRDAPFVGTGPATYLFDFTSYKPVEFNQLKFWNFSFGAANNELLQVLATWGMFGLLSLLVLIVVVAVVGKKFLVSDPHTLHTLREENNDSYVITPALALSVLFAMVLLLVHASTLVSVVGTFFLLAAFMASQKQIREKAFGVSMGIKVATADNKQLDLLPFVVLVLFLVAVVPLSRKVYSVVAADYYHRLALSQASTDGTKTYEYLQKAETLNPNVDLYRVDMAQTNFALANALASQKGPTQDNPNGTLNDDDKQTIQTLVTQAINEGRASVLLSPRSARNWEVLALIYRNITGVANNALTFSLDAYGRAIQMDPLNPVLRVNVGTIYYATKSYDLAIRFFTDAVNLKPDYVNGYYNLAIAFRDKGDLQNAQLVADQAVQLLQKDFASEEFSTASEAVRETKTRDYDTATALLNEIKDKINSGSEAQTGETTGETALQNPDLPSIDVPNLQNPPEAAVPPAVEENPQAIVPQLTPDISPVITPIPSPTQ